MANTHGYRIRASDIPPDGVHVMPEAVAVAIESAKERGGSIEALCWIGYEPRFAWKTREVGGFDSFRCSVYNADRFRTNTGVVGHGRSADLAALDAHAQILSLRQRINGDMG